MTDARIADVVARRRVRLVSGESGAVRGQRPSPAVQGIAPRVALTNSVSSGRIAREQPCGGSRRHPEGGISAIERSTRSPTLALKASRPEVRVRDDPVDERGEGYGQCKSNPRTRRYPSVDCQHLTGKRGAVNRTHQDFTPRRDAERDERLTPGEVRTVRGTVLTGG